MRNDTGFAFYTKALHEVFPNIRIKSGYRHSLASSLFTQPASPATKDISGRIVFALFSSKKNARIKRAFSCSA